MEVEVINRQLAGVVDVFLNVVVSGDLDVGGLDRFFGLAGHGVVPPSASLGPTAVWVAAFAAAGFRRG